MLEQAGESAVAGVSWAVRVMVRLPPSPTASHSLDRSRPLQRSTTCLSLGRQVAGGASQRHASTSDYEEIFLPVKT